MYILGINAFHGDSSACIFKDGKLIAAIEEERLRRIKHWAGFPSESIKFCLDECNITVNDLDYVTISRDPSANFYNKIIHIIKNFVGFKILKNRLKNTKKVRSIKQELAKVFGVLKMKLRLNSTILNITEVTWQVPFLLVHLKNQPYCQLMGLVILHLQ